MPALPSFLRRAALCLFWSFSGLAGGQTLDNEKATYATLTSATVTMTGHSELHVTGTGDPIPGCIIHLNSEDSWVFFPNIAPATVVSNLVSRVRVNGATAVADTNVRVVQYVNGAVVIPQPPGFRPLEVFTGTQMTGTAAKLATYTGYNNAGLGIFADKIRSFILKRGYTATFAANEDGTVSSRNFVAQDSDLEVSFMPAGLDGTVSFVRVYPWRWVSKKGSCDVDPVALNAKWHYNWSNSQNSARNWEYVPIKQQPFWPGLGGVGDYRNQQVSHVLGFNEPNNNVEDAWKNLNPQGSVSDAVGRWNELLGTGLRVGAPAVTDGGSSWIVDFMNQANAAGKRVDYVPVHYYRSYSGNSPSGATTAMYNFLKSIYDATGKPIWVTEFNNGANWTDNAHDPDATQNRNVIEAMVTMMDNTPWIERYAVYSNVEWFRDTHYEDGSLTPMGTMYRDRLSPMAYQQVVPNTGSSGNASYLFEDSIRDTQSGNNPLVYGTPKHVAGKHGKALSLDGTDDYLALPGRLGDSNDFSFGGWVKWNGGNQWQRIFDLGNGQASNMFLTPRSGGNTLRFTIKYNNGAEQQLNTTQLTAGVWTHLAVTISGDTGKLFVNGGLVNTNPAMTYNPSQLGTETNYLGKSQYPDALFGGLLDDTRFFNYALSDAQVTALAGSTAPQLVASPTIGSPVVDQVFTGSLASQLAVGSPAATFSKLGGPAWLAVAADGSLFGVPRIADAGPSQLFIRATSAGGAVSDVLIPINVGGADPLARYAFNNSALATAGIANATVAGGAAYVAGQKGQAIDLDGTDDHVVLPGGIASGDEITLATWVQWDGGANWQRIFDFGTGTGSYLFLTPKSGTNTLRFVILNNGTEKVVETGALTAGAWTHVAVTLGGGTGKLYVNGTLADTEPGITIKPSDIRPTLNYLGRSMFAADPYFNGRIEEFNVFHRVLTATEINTLRNGNAPTVTINPRVLVAATVGSPYEASLGGAATVSPGSITWSKVGGPAWLGVESDGRISGVPSSSDSGTLPFRVRATTSGLLATDLDLTLHVQPAADLRVHLEFDGNASGSVGAIHASTTGSPSYTAGVFDQAVDLDGTDDFLQLPVGIASDLTDCTFAVRFRWDGGNAWQRIFDFGNNTTQNFFLTPGSSGGTLRFTITTTGNTAPQFIETAAPAVGEWTHVAVVLSGNTGTMYVNGVAAASGAITIDPAQIAPAVNYLGKSQWPDPLFNGAIDDFRIFARALDATEVKAMAVPPAAVAVPRGYHWWAIQQSFPVGEGGAEFDADGDGLSNIIEWLQGSDPSSGGSGQMPSASRLSAEAVGLAGEKSYLGFSFRIRKDRPGVTLIPEGAATLAELVTPAAAANISEAGPALDDGDFEIFTWYYEVPIEDAATGFARLRVVQE
ncbi:glycosyl hydrolase [Luteolibacter arcticus]|uniref:Glycosyl hydrolase n=1 Tax=Luteolibacter arcticus TaxID=1581411 RepID=A0ABT3GQK2_9BACT|nr:LamG-like jellyroll fold domain-containing protein [Luteolibacter arcticus]MCW1925801.1 glycosyl hydrolase [Luteolibacter arcticus]